MDSRITPINITRKKRHRKQVATDDILNEQKKIIFYIENEC
jgi:hypothetical protein